jgi:hypothetical protein
MRRSPWTSSSGPRTVNSTTTAAGDRPEVGELQPQVGSSAAAGAGSTVTVIGPSRFIGAASPAR